MKLTESQEDRAEQSLKEEHEAIKAYELRRRGTSGPLRAAFDHALPEERDHARLFKEALEADEKSEDKD